MTSHERYAQRLNMINDGAHFPHHDLIDREIRTHGEAMPDNNGKLIHLTPTGFAALTYYRANCESVIASELLREGI